MSEKGDTLGWITYNGHSFSSLPPDVQQRILEQRRHEPIAELRLQLLGPDGAEAQVQFRVAGMRSPELGTGPERAVTYARLLENLKQGFESVLPSLADEHLVGREPPQCTFCGKSQEEVRLIGGPSYVFPIFICHECVALCSAIIAEGSDASPSD